MRARRPSDRRIRLLLLLLLAVLGISLVRATWLQTVRAADLSQRASSQQSETVTIPAGRGTIVDRMGVQLAIAEEAVTVYANPRQVTSPRQVALAAAKTLGVDADALYPQLLDKSKGFVYVMRKADAERAKALEKRNLAGVGFLREERRVYPQGAVAAHVLGYAGTDNRGLAGLELQLEPVLGGRDGSETFVKDPFGRVLNVVKSSPERPGRDVFLTIDHTIQANVESVLGLDGVAVGSRSGNGRCARCAVGWRPRDGGLSRLRRERLRADGRRPPSQRGGHGHIRAGIDVQARDRGRGSLGGTRQREQPVHAALRDPCCGPRRARRGAARNGDDDGRPDPGAVFERRRDHARAVARPAASRPLDRTLRLREADGNRLPGETPGIVLPVERWSGSTIGNVPIGQGIGVTAVQMAAAYAAVANGGMWIAPHLVDHVSGGGRARPERRRVLSRADRETRCFGCSRTWCSRDRHARRSARVQDRRQDGTAAKPDPVNGGYSETNYVASFIGIVPASRPRFVILVSVDEPRGAIWGGVIAAPAFKRIADFALQYLEVPPDDPASLATSG